MNFVTEQFIQFYKKHPVLTTINVLLSCMFPVDDILVPYLVGIIVANVQSKSNWLRPLSWLIALLIGMQIFYTTIFWHDAKLYPKMQNYIRHGMTSDLISKYTDFKKELSLGEVMSRFVKIPMTTTFLFEQFKNHIFPYFISFCVTSWFIYGYDKFMGVTMFVSASILYAVILLSPKICMKSALDLDDSLARIDEETEDVMRNLSSVHASGQIASEILRLETYEAEYERKFFDSTTCIVRQRLIATIALVIMLLAFLYRSYVGLRNKTLSVAAFVTIFTIIVQWFATLGWLASTIKQMLTEFGIIQSYNTLIHEHVQEEQSEPNINNAWSPYIVSSGLFVDHVTFTVEGRRTPILDGVTFAVGPSQKVAIIGDIGSGKSTLLKILSGLKKPTAGKVFLDGRELTAIETGFNHSLIAYVQQMPLLFNRSVYENIVYGIPDAARAHVEYLIEQMGLSDAFANLDGGLDASAGKHGANLSGGQRQIVQCLRVMLQNPQVLLLDEVTSSLDTHTKKRLFGLFKVMFQGKIVVMVTHDNDILSLADKVIRMKDGHIMSEEKLRHYA